MTRSRRWVASSSPRTASPRTLMFRRAPSAARFSRCLRRRACSAGRMIPVEASRICQWTSFIDGSGASADSRPTARRPTWSRTPRACAVGRGRCGAQRGRSPARVRDPHHLVGEGHRHRQPGGVPQQPGQPAPVRLLPAGALALGVGHPARGAGHGAVDDRIGVGTGGGELSRGDVHESNRGPATGRTQCGGPCGGGFSVTEEPARTPQRGAPGGPTGPRPRPRRSSRSARR